MMHPVTGKRSLRERPVVLVVLAALAPLVLLLGTPSRAQNRVDEVPTVQPPPDEKEPENKAGNKKVEAAVGRGLKWLAQQQARDGHWSPDRRSDDVAGTALGVLAFLGDGITHKGSARKGLPDYSKTVAAALDWLTKKQARDGSFGSDVSSSALAALALCESYGMTSDPKLKVAAQKALNYLARAQDLSSGGWSSRPRTAADLALTGWVLMALRSGQLAGLGVPRQTMRRAELFLDSVEKKKGSYSDRPGGTESIDATAVGLLGRQFLGVNPRNPALQMGVQRLMKHLPGDRNDYSHLYFTTLTLHHLGGDNWKVWTEGPPKGKGLFDVLLHKQDAATGSWAADPKTPGGRLAATALALLCLEIEGRQLPLYRRGR